MTPPSKQNLLHRLLLSGVEKEVRSDEDKRILLSNQIACLLALAAAPYGFLFFAAGLSFLSMMIVPTVGILLSVILLNQTGKQDLARYVLIVHSALCVLFFSHSFGENAGVQYLYFGISAIPFVLFSEKEKISKVSLFLLPIGLLYLSEITGYHLFRQYEIDPIYIKSIFFSVTFITFIIVGFSIRFYQKIQERTQHELKNALETLHAQQDLLKRRIQAIHEMSEQCNTMSEWHMVCRHTFQSHLNLTPLIWIADDVQTPLKGAVPAHLEISDIQSHAILEKSNCIDWKEKGISILIPMLSSAGMTGLIGIAPEETLSKEDLEFAILVAKELQKTFQFIKSADTIVGLSWSLGLTNGLWRAYINKWQREITSPNIAPASGCHKNLNTPAFLRSNNFPSFRVPLYP